jgi:dipeptidase E
MADELRALVGDGARVGVTANALDLVVSDAERASWLAREVAALAEAGCAVAERDLRRHYGRPGSIDEVLDGLDAVWATGGNVFILRDALRRSGLDAALAARLADDTLAYGGSSAGACVCGPTLAGFELIDDAHAAGEPIFAGLGLVPFSIAPHFRTPGEAGDTIDRLVTHFRDTGMPYRALEDGEAIVVRDGEVETVVARPP